MLHQGRTERQLFPPLFSCLQAWRTYYQYHSEYVCAEGKLKDAEKQEEKQKQSAAKKLERLIEKVNRLMFYLFTLCMFVPIPLTTCPLTACLCSTATGQSSRNLLEMQQGAERVPPEPGCSQLLHEEVLPS